MLHERAFFFYSILFNEYLQIKTIIFYSITLNHTHIMKQTGLSHRTFRKLPVSFYKAFSCRNQNLRILLGISFLFFLFISAFSQPVINKDKDAYPDPLNTSANGTCVGEDDCVIELPSIKTGDEYILEIPLITGIDRDKVEFELLEGFDNCALGTHYEFITDTADPENGTLKLLAGWDCAPLDMHPDYFEFKIMAMYDNGMGVTPDNCVFKLPVISRKTVQVVLVLDLSGSMGLITTNGIESRLNVLKTAVGTFMDKFEEFRIDGDEIGVSYFSTTVIQPNDPPGSGFIPITIPADDPGSFEIITGDLAPRTPQQLTALGAGLLDAKNKLATTNPELITRTILLFTDGHQNQDPFINTEGTYAGVTALNEDQLNPEDSICYYTVGIGSAGSAPVFLDNISKKNRGEPLYTTEGTADEMFEFFNQHFDGLLNNGSPQILYIKKGSLVEGKENFTFHVNAGVTKILFQVMHPEEAIKFRIEKDGLDLSSYARIKRRSKYTIIILDFPVVSISDTPVEPVLSNGEYIFSISGSSEMPYTLTTYVDDHQLDYNCQVEGNKHVVGESLDFNVGLSYAGNALIEENNKVKAIILKPGDDLGHLLSVTETPGLSDLLPDISPAFQKFNDLMKGDAEFKEALELQEQIIELTNNGDGSYTGESGDFEISGIYKIIFMINGEIPGKGIFERQKTVCTYMNWGQMDEEQTTQSITVSRDGTSALVQFRPINKFGYYLGPAFNSHITVKVNGKPFATNNIKDNLNGSYTLPLNLASEKDNPKISISVMGESFYKGKLNCLAKEPIKSWKLTVLAILFILLVFYYSGLLTAIKVPVWVWWSLTILWLILLLLEWQCILVL